MNRKEEIKQAAYSKYCNDSSVTFNLQCDCFSDGAKWADRTLIEKACKWIVQQEEIIGISFENDFIERFKKAMEE